MTDVAEQSPQQVREKALPLKVKLRRAERRRKLGALALIAPLFVFLIVTFAAPIADMLLRAVRNDEIADALPDTIAALRGWDGNGPPSEATFAALAEELLASRRARTLPGAAKRLNLEIVGFRSLLFNTARKLPREAPPSWRETFLEIDVRWGDPHYWAAIARGGWPATPYYLMASLDLRLDADNAVVSLPEDKQLYRDVFFRTFWMASVVTVLCFLLGYPVAYLLAELPARSRNLLMILVLLPFYTSLLVRTAAWVVLLQREGLVNESLLLLSLTDKPVQLVYNRIGVYIAMVHILLPYMVLPLFSVMKGISPSHVRAAASLGANPWTVFWRVYFPQTLPGIGAGSLLVFILAIGYYITPALVGGPKDQMISYFVAYFTNTVINWGMAAALGAVLLASTLALYAVYNRLVGIERMKLG